VDVITPTHVVTNALIARRARVAAGDQSESLLSQTSNARWFIFGGMAPDLGLYVLTAGAAVFYPLVRGLTLEASLRLAFDDLFFNNPLWIVVQNTFHSPVVVGTLALVGKATGRGRLTSFALGCLLHTAMDIPVHHNDGPLVFFPFDWNTRFHSPLSYWDPDHYGNIIGPIDLAITVLGGSFLLASWWKRRWSAPNGSIDS